MKDKPLGSIIVVTRNRPVILEKMLDETRKQAGYRDFEIIIANVGGEIDIKRNLEGTFPEIKFINFLKQEGYIGLRSRLFKEAKADLVFFLDDDSWFEEERALMRAVRIFEEYPQAGILSFGIRLPDGWTIPHSLSGTAPYRVASYMGCAHAVRKVFFEDNDIYDADYFRQGEERDFAIKCLDKNYDILQVNSIIVYHRQVALNRDHQFIHGYAFRNELFFYLKYFPTILCGIFMLKCIISHSIFCFKKGWFAAYFFGLKKFINDFFKFLKKRRPVKMTTAKKYIYLKKQTQERRSW